MPEYDYKSIMREIGFDETAVSTVEIVRSKICNNTFYREIVAHMDKNDRDWFLLDADVLKLSGSENTDYLETCLAVLCLNTYIVFKRYSEIGTDRQIIIETLKDIKSKCVECLNVFGKYGTFVFPWFRYHFSATLFKLGRLQFEVMEYRVNDEYSGHGVSVKRGDTVLNVHIPSGEPMPPEAVEDSFRQAYEYFPELRRNGKMLIQCESWMIFPPYVGIMDENSNIRRFAERFEILNNVPYDSFVDGWRIFNTVAQDADNYPQDTKLRRAFVKYIKDGGVFGEGCGVTVYE